MQGLIALNNAGKVGKPAPPWWLRGDHLAVLLSSRDGQSQPPEDLAYVQSRGRETIWVLTSQ